MSLLQTGYPIILPAGKTATLIEFYTDTLGITKTKSTQDNSTENTLSEVEIILNAKSHLNHILIHCDNIPLNEFTQNYTSCFQKSVKTMRLNIHQQANSLYQATLIVSGNQLNTFHIDNYLNEAEAQSDIRILKYSRNNQNISVQSTTHHIVPNTTSQTIARGIVDHQAKGSFTGKIIVAKNASKTLAKLENKNLLLSKTAEMSTCPLLEIYNDDVQCTHGATVGHLDDDALFYLRSRGIPQKDATSMLIRAFMEPAFKHIKSNEHLPTLVEGLFHEF